MLPDGFFRPSTHLASHSQGLPPQHTRPHQLSAPRCTWSTYLADVYLKSNFCVPSTGLAAWLARVHKVMLSEREVSDSREGGQRRRSWAVSFKENSAF